VGRITGRLFFHSIFEYAFCIQMNGCVGAKLRANFVVPLAGATGFDDIWHSLSPPHDDRSRDAWVDCSSRVILKWKYLMIPAGGRSYAEARSPICRGRTIDLYGERSAVSVTMIGMGLAPMGFE
jgi:hypothetical protein